MKNILNERQKHYMENIRIFQTHDGFEAQEADSYISDSMNPKGEWCTYWKTLKTYKTKKAAINYLMKIVACNFPAGHDVTPIRTALESA